MYQNDRLLEKPSPLYKISSPKAIKSCSPCVRRLWNICSTAHVQGKMVLPAKPTDFQRLIVIFMVHFGLLATTDLASLFDDLAAFQVNVSVAAAVHLVPLDWVEWVKFAPLPQILRMTLKAPSI